MKLIALLAASTMMASPVAATYNANTACTVFQHYHFGGHKWAVGEGRYDIHQLIRNGVQDNISSYKVAYGYQMVACEHAGFKGTCKTFTGQSNVPAHFNDKISSIKCIKPALNIHECKRSRHWWYVSPMNQSGNTIQVMSQTGKLYNVDNKTAKGASRVAHTNKDLHQFILPYYRQGFFMRLVTPTGVHGPFQYCPINTPIALDLNNSGAVERIQGEFKFDITGDGHYETLEEWFAPTEGILINTAHPIIDGKVNGHHLFGDMGQTYTDGFDKMEKELDDNKDGLVSGSELTTLAVWVDANSNARVDEGELSTLEEKGIVSLTSAHDSKFVSSAIMKDGSTMMVEDLWLSVKHEDVN